MSTALKQRMVLFTTLYRRRMEIESTQGAGLFWYLADASLYILVHALVFARSAAMRHENLPDYLPPMVAHGAFVCCGILPWKALATAGSTGSRVFRANGTLVRKSQLKPIFFALLDSVHQFVQFCAALGVLFVILICAGYRPTMALATLPLLLVVQYALLLSVCLLTASLGVFFPAMASVWGMLSRIMLWTTPIVYARRALPEWAAQILSWSPLWSLVESYRYLIVRGTLVPTHEWWRLCLAVMCCLIVGFVVYRALAEDIPDFV